MLELYQSEGCPHSTEVREKLTELGITYVTLSESDEIVSYLETHYG